MDNSTDFKNFNLCVISLLASVIFSPVRREFVVLRMPSNFGLHLGALNTMQEGSDSCFNHMVNADSSV